MPHFKCKNNKIYNSLHSFSSTTAKIWNSLPNAIGTTCDINVLKILNYPTISPPFSNLPFKIPTKGGGPGDISLVAICKQQVYVCLCVWCVFVYLHMRMHMCTFVCVCVCVCVCCGWVCACTRIFYSEYGVHGSGLECIAKVKWYATISTYLKSHGNFVCNIKKNYVQRRF